ncbi:hypothetical protein GOBAR_AA13519 [Gossypium barbadense]|uniref:Uncharacterized protein n=1 Tax=Gossypium barbadense TaxID=3634 RepID=A0A2P5XUZ4_GOSBA|nr:hypothetical protein GOBAR_AA13519 [Gossypium barbadense]
MPLEWDLTLRATSRRAMVGTSCWLREEGAVSKLDDICRSFCSGPQEWILRELLLIMLLFRIWEYRLALMDKVARSHKTPKLECLEVGEPTSYTTKLQNNMMQRIRRSLGFSYGIELATNMDYPWVVMEDFNKILFSHEKQGDSSEMNSLVDDFQTVLEDIELYDLRYVGY